MGVSSCPAEKKIGITRAHLEEDTGKINHIGGGGRIHDAEYSLIDYNRAGIPLLEIVSEPEISSAEEARQYVSELRAILLATEVSDGKMEEGSMRVDVNISVKPKGSKDLGVRSEIKNVNSLKSLSRAVEYEVNRHINLIESGKKILQETRHFNEATGETRSLRSKEDDMDYRYFAEPDLVPLDPDPLWIEEIKSQLSLLPKERRNKLKELSKAQDSVVALLVIRGIDDLVNDTILKGGNPEQVVKLAEQNLAEGAGKLTPELFIEVINEKLSSTQLKTVLTEVVATGKSPKEIVEELGIEAVDENELESLVDQLIAENPDEWERYKQGDKKIEGFFVGKMMKATQGKADGKVVADLLSSKSANS